MNNCICSNINDYYGNIFQFGLELLDFYNLINYFYKIERFKAKFKAIIF